MQQVHSNSPDTAPEVQLFEGFEASHAGWYAPQHVVSNIETLQLTEVAHAVWQAVQVVGAQVQLHQGLARANVIWQSIDAVVLQPQDLQGCHARAGPSPSSDMVLLDRSSSLRNIMSFQTYIYILQ